jgi:photosystem II stability/assembly factor-like uncharacterized protein
MPRGLMVWQKNVLGQKKGYLYDVIYTTHSGFHLGYFQGKLFILRTFDAGVTWSELPEDERPQVLEGQGGFAASGTCLVTQVTSP